MRGYVIEELQEMTVQLHTHIGKSNEELSTSHMLRGEESESSQQRHYPISWQGSRFRGKICRSRWIVGTSPQRRASDSPFASHHKSISGSRLQGTVR